MPTKFLSETRNGRDHLGGVEVSVGDMKTDLKKWNLGMWTGFSWMRMRFSGMLWWTQCEM
jgi:hypothetical protein